MGCKACKCAKAVTERDVELDPLLDKAEPEGTAEATEAPAEDLWHFPPVAEDSLAVQLSGGCLDVFVLFVALLGGRYITVIALQEVNVNEFARVLVSLQRLNWVALMGSLCLLFLFVLFLGAVRPMRGGKGYDFNMHRQEPLAQALHISLTKIRKLFIPVFGAGYTCFRLIADIMALKDLYENSDFGAFGVKCSMILLGACCDAVWAYRSTPDALMYMPPLGIRSRQVSWLPVCTAFLAFSQLLPACLLPLCLILFMTSCTAPELERALEVLHLCKVLDACLQASLLTETVPSFFLNIFLLAGSGLSSTSWHVLALSTLMAGCSLTRTFALIDGRGEVSYFVNGLPTVVGTAPLASGLFVFILLYRASTLLANSFLPLALQTTMDWTGLPVALMLLGLDLLLQLLQVWCVTKNWKKLPFAIWALLTPPEPLLHSSRPLFTCKLQIWVTLKAVLYAAFFGLLLAIEKFYDFQPNYSDPIVRVLFVAICAQWPLFLSLRQASYPRSNFNCKLPEDFTTEEVPIHLLKIWWDAHPHRDLSSSSVGDVGAEIVAQMLVSDKVVTELKLTDDKIGPTGAWALCSALSKNDTLTSLFLDGNPIGAARFARLQLLSTSKLEVLSLSRIRLGNSLEPLAELLQRTQTLKKLYLNETDMGPLGVGVLSDGLRENRSLEVLTLNKNDMGGGMSKLIGALRSCLLSTIYLAENDLTDAQLKELLGALPQMDTLKKLNLARNHFSLQLFVEVMEQQPEVVIRIRSLSELRVSAAYEADEKMVLRMKEAGVKVEVE